MNTKPKLQADHDAADKAVLGAIARGASDAQLSALKRARAALETQIDAAALAPYIARCLVVLRGGGRLTAAHRRGLDAARAAGYVTGTMRTAQLTATGRQVIEARVAELHK